MAKLPASSGFYVKDMKVENGNLVCNFKANWRLRLFVKILNFWAWIIGLSYIFSLKKEKEVGTTGKTD